MLTDSSLLRFVSEQKNFSHCKTVSPSACLTYLGNAMGWPKWDNNSRADRPMLKMPLVRISPLGGIVWAYLFSFWQLMTKSCGTVTALLRCCCKAQCRIDSLDHTNNIQKKDKAYTQVLHLGIRSFFWKCPFVQQKIVAFFRSSRFFLSCSSSENLFFVFFRKSETFLLLAVSFVRQSSGPSQPPMPTLKIEN